MTTRYYYVQVWKKLSVYKAELAADFVEKVRATCYVTAAEKILQQHSCIVADVYTATKTTHFLGTWYSDVSVNI